MGVKAAAMAQTAMAPYSSVVWSSLRYADRARSADTRSELAISGASAAWASAASTSTRRHARCRRRVDRPHTTAAATQPTASRAKSGWCITAAPFSD